MKIVLSSVPYSNPLAVRGETVIVLNPIALGYIAAALKVNKATEDDEVVILEKESLLHNLKTLKEDIIREQPDVLGVSVYIWNYYRAIKLCEMVKEDNPDITIVLGGPQVTYTAGSVLKENPSVDIVVRGEGEVTFCELIEALKKNLSLRPIKGISFRHNNQIIHNPPRPQIQDLDSIPSPYLEGIMDLSLSERLDLFTARGCFYRCAYCIWHQFRKGIGLHSMERVVDELKFVYDRGVKRVIFWDSVFDSPQRAKILCEYISKEGLDSHMLIFQNPWTVTPEQLTMLSRTGAFVICIGVQSMNAESLRMVNRPHNTEQTKKALDYLKESEIPSVVDIILGLPGETLETYKAGVDYIASKGFVISPNILQLLPGSALFKKAVACGLRYQTDPPYMVYATPTMSTEDIVKGFKYTFYAESREIRRRITSSEENPIRLPWREGDSLFGG